MPETLLRVTVWNEFIHERTAARPREIYPEGIHAVLAAALRDRLGPSMACRPKSFPGPTSSPGGAMPPMTGWPMRSSSASTGACWRAWAS